MKPSFRWLPLCLIILILAALGSAGAAQRPNDPHYRTLPRPKVLFIGDRTTRQGLAELIRVNAPADVTFAAIQYNDLDFHHLCDKPLEETKQDQQYVRAQAAAYLDETIADLGRFDIVIAQFHPKAEGTEQMQRRLVDWVKGGGRLIFINPRWEITFKGTPVAAVIPVRAERYKRWANGVPGATDHPLSRGIPLETIGAHFYGPIYEPADETCEPLTRTAFARGGRGRRLDTQFWYRRLPGGGQVVHLFQASGGKWQWNSGTNYEMYAAQRPDDSAAWLAFYRRLLYGLLYGERAFPVLAKIALPEDAEATAGKELKVPVDVENRTEAARGVEVVLHAWHRRTSERRTMRQALELKPGERRVIELPLPLDLPCTDPYVVLDAEVLDANSKHLLSSARRWLAWNHQVPLTVKTDRHSYREGDTITTEVTIPEAARDRPHTLRVFLVDRRGRALQEAEADNAKAELRMPGWGPEHVGSYWVTVLAEREGSVLGSGRVQVQLDRPWNMRERFEWSVWSWGARGRLLTVMRDAGFNALGMHGNSYVADRFAMRQYVEGTGINTFSVTIDHDNWDAVREQMEKTIAKLNKQRGPDARSKSLVSLGEESGFKGGWGRRYYWEADTAPAHVQRVFDKYLEELYGGDIARLNLEWGTRYKAFSEIPLERAKVKHPRRVFVTSQAWEAMQKKGQGEDRLPVEVREVDPARRFLAHSAPYYETYRFFDWYYQRYCDMATAVYRAERNPVPRTIMSAPGGFYPKVDVYNFGGQGPFYPKEASLVGNAIARRDYGDVPGFSAAMWAYFDLRTLWSCVVYSRILAGDTHMDYWVDVPLTFNTDLTHTRASFWTKALRARLRPIEPILLHKHFRYTPGLGMYVPRQPLSKGVTGRHFGSAISANAPVYSALEKSGHMPKVVHADRLEGLRVVVASYAQVVSEEDARRLKAFVEGGGLLISTPWLGSCTEHGNALSVYPEKGSVLAGLLGFRLVNTSQQPVKESVEVTLPAGFGLDDPLKLLGKGKDRVINLTGDVEVLAAYDDGTPLLLSRAVGTGRVLYLNMVYDWNHWWNSFYEPSRQAYLDLMRSMVALGGVRPEYGIMFDSLEKTDANKGWWGMKMTGRPNAGDSVPWWGSQTYEDPSGQLRYLAVFSDHRSPVITAKVKWHAPNVKAADLLTGQPVRLTEGAASLTLGPGEAAFWAFAPALPTAVQLKAPQQVRAGDRVPLQITVQGMDADAGMTVDVRGPDGRRLPAHTLPAVTLKGGVGEVTIPTALNDPPGTCAVTVTESLTRKSATARVQVQRVDSVAAPVLTPFPPREGDRWPRAAMSDEEFLGLLRRLRAVYLGEHRGLEAKYMLSYFLNVPFRPAGRHAIVRRLHEADWAAHAPAVRDAAKGGEWFVLMAEDLNQSPRGPAPRPWTTVSAESRTALTGGAEGEELPGNQVRLPITVVRVGKGGFIFSEASVDESAYHSSDFVGWHKKLKEACRAARRD